MTNLLLNTAPPKAAQGHAPIEGRVRESGRALFAADPAAAVTDVRANALRFDAMLHAAHAPAVPLSLHAGALQELDADASAESVEAPREELSSSGTSLAAVPLQHTVAASAEMTKQLSRTTAADASAGSAAQVQSVSATFVAGEAVAVNDVAASPLQGTMTVSISESGGAAAPVSISLAAASAMAAVAPRAEGGQSVPESALLQLASQSVASAAATLAAFASDAPVTNLADHNGNVARQPLAALLGERLQVQIGQRSEHAVVRLDPPYMGTIEIIIRQEAGQLHVQMRASNSEVARQLHVIGETLRQDLVQRQHGDVSVQVSDSREGERQRQQQQQQQQRASQQRQEELGRALNEAGEEHGSFAMTAASE